MEVELTAEAKDKRLNRLVVLTVDILSVTMGLGNIKDGNIVPVMAQAQANSLDRWNEYQAIRTKLRITETIRGELAAASDQSRAPPTLAMFSGDIAKYNSESPVLARQARDFSAKYDALNIHDDQFDAADAALSTASIAAVAALTESMIPLVASSSTTNGRSR